MSGNPFRVSPSPQQATAAPLPTLSFIDTDSSSNIDGTLDGLDADNASSLPPAKTKKSVRIESPTSSIPHPVYSDTDDELFPRISQGRHAGSPPPTSPAAFSDNFEDYHPMNPSDENEARDNAQDGRDVPANTSNDSEMVAAVSSPSGAPANPFSRTLATIEPQERASGELARQNKDRTAVEKPASASTKGNLDVEGFKRLLMTGINPTSSEHASQPAVASNPAVPTVFESSSSTDTSSISRQSLFEPVHEPHVESPRTSYEMAPSDDETMGLVTDVKKPEKKKKPPLPKHRHGKLVTSRTPQTVSFSDFSASEAMSSPAAQSRENSDLNKPLPPTPPVLPHSTPIISPEVVHDEAPPLETRASGSSDQSESAVAQKKAPPPIPIARRHSQLRTVTGNRSRSNSSLTLSSQQSTDFPLLSPAVPAELTSSSSSQKSPPPPPPARRHGASLTGKTQSASSSTTELPSTATSRRPTVTSPTPPPPRRTAATSSPPSPVPGSAGLARAASTSSNRNPSRNVSNENPSMPPPPPPPPRRGQAGRSSMDKERPSQLPAASPTEGRRTSGDYKRNSIDGPRRASVASESSLRREYAPSVDDENALYSPREEPAEEQGGLQPTASSPSSNILDDMEKFQREIDALRAQYKPGS